MLVQRTKDIKLEELNAVREHEIACRKLKHHLELGIKRDKVCSACCAIVLCWPTVASEPTQIMRCRAAHWLALPYAPCLMWKNCQIR